MHTFGAANTPVHRILLAALVGNPNLTVLVNFFDLHRRAHFSKPLNIRLSVFAQDGR